MKDPWVKLKPICREKSYLSVKACGMINRKCKVEEQKKGEESSPHHQRERDGTFTDRDTCEQHPAGVSGKRKGGDKTTRRKITRHR